MHYFYCVLVSYKVCYFNFNLPAVFSVLFGFIKKFFYFCLFKYVYFKTFFNTNAFYNNWASVRVHFLSLIPPCAKLATYQIKGIIFDENTASAIFYFLHQSINIKIYHSANAFRNCRKLSDFFSLVKYGLLSISSKTCFNGLSDSSHICYIQRTKN